MTRRRVSNPLVPDYRAQSVRYGLTVGHEYRLPPPMLAIQAQQLPQNDENAEQHEAAEGTEQEAEEAVHAVEYGQAHEVGDRHPDARAQQQRSATMMTRAAQVATGDPDSSPPRWGAMRSEKCQARNSAMIHVTRAIASRRKPRTDPTAAEVRMAAITR